MNDKLTVVLYLRTTRGNHVTFYAEVKGNRGTASRGGSKNSGMPAHVRGWNVGVKVYIAVDDHGDDHVFVYKTGGSNQGSQGELITDFIGE